MTLLKSSVQRRTVPRVGKTRLLETPVPLDKERARRHTIRKTRLN